MHAKLPGGGETHYLLAGCPCSCPLAETLRVPLPTTGPGEPADPRSASSVDDSVELEVLESSPAPSRRRAAPPGQAGLLPAQLPDGLERVSTRWTSAAVLVLQLPHFPKGLLLFFSDIRHKNGVKIKEKGYFDILRAGRLSISYYL